MNCLVVEPDLFPAKRASSPHPIPTFFLSGLSHSQALCLNQIGLNPNFCTLWETSGFLLVLCLATVYSISIFIDVCLFFPLSSIASVLTKLDFITFWCVLTFVMCLICDVAFVNRSNRTCTALKAVQKF